MTSSEIYDYAQLTDVLPLQGREWIFLVRMLPTCSPDGALIPYNHV
jgi:hypothetical protein